VITLPSEGTRPETASPLAIIHQKETELQRRLEAARRQAEVDLQAARQEARQRIAQAEETGRTEARAIFEQGLAATQQEIEAILTAAQAEAATLQQRVTPHLDDAAAQIARLVLPCPAASA
jgi:vacuolar-type H+-ATPase subunit H